MTTEEWKMRQASGTRRSPGEKIVKEIKRAKRKHTSQPSSCDIWFSRIQDQLVGDQRPQWRRHLKEQCVKQCWWYSGTQIPNPLISVIDTLERRQLAVIRSMSLKQKTSNQRTVNGTAKIESKARAVLMQVESKWLISIPVHWSKKDIKASRL